jgi:predicted extracellular nuclease
MRASRLIPLAAILLAAAVPAVAQAQSPIGEIQGPVQDTDNGATHRSPFAPPSGNGSSSAFVTTRGVVRQKLLTRTSAGQANYGFFLQSTAATADGDPLSSDGIFVFQGRFTDLIGGYVPQVGDEIVVSARVSEFFNFTELTTATAQMTPASSPASSTAPTGSSCRRPAQATRCSGRAHRWTTARLGCPTTPTSRTPRC